MVRALSYKISLGTLRAFQITHGGGHQRLGAHYLYTGPSANGYIERGGEGIQGIRAATKHDKVALHLLPGWCSNRTTDRPLAGAGVRA